METTARLACLALMLALSACSSGGGEEQASTRPTSFDGEVLRIAVARADGRAEHFSSLRDEWYSWSWFPFMPNHSGRRWTMGKTDRDGVSLAYALVSWDNDDPTDYLSAGFWMRFDGARTTRRLDPANAEIQPFIDGSELDARFPPELPVSGTANYAGSAGGVYRYRPPGAEPLAEEFTATMTLQADFAAGTVAGCIGCVGDIALEREHLYVLLGWRGGEAAVQHPPADYEIRFAPTAIGATGGFAGATVAVDPPGPHRRRVGRVLVRPFLQPRRRGRNPKACRRPRQRFLRGGRRRRGQLRFDLYRPAPDPAATTCSGRIASRILKRCISGGGATPPAKPWTEAALTGLAVPLRHRWPVNGRWQRYRSLSSCATTNAATSSLAMRVNRGCVGWPIRSGFR